MPPPNLPETITLCLGILGYVTVALIPAAVIIATVFLIRRYLDRKEIP